MKNDLEGKLWGKAGTAVRLGNYKTGIHSNLKGNSVEIQTDLQEESEIFPILYKGKVTITAERPNLTERIKVVISRGIKLEIVRTD